MKKVFIIAGEASGDLHASNLVKHLNASAQNFTFQGWGGDLMKAQGVDILKDYKELAFMGFFEVVMNLRTILGNFKVVKKQILAFQPDYVILVDYPGFNLRMAEFCHNQGIKVAYYISPQIWAWKKNRVYKIKKYVDTMITILPFEKDFYAKFGMEVEYVGHPMLDAIQVNKNTENYIALLPGSRSQEIVNTLPVMNEVAKRFPKEKFIVVQAPNKATTDYQWHITAKNITLSSEGTSKVLNGAKAAVVASGTATLETALYQVPQVVVYKGGEISYQIAKRIVDLDFISLVNLILEKEAVKELIQSDFNEESLHRELLKLLEDKSFLEKQNADYKALIEVLGGKGASQRAANHLLEIF